MKQLTPRRHLVELVPRSMASIQSEAQVVTQAFGWVKGINVPDLTRLPHRSDEVAMALVSQHIWSIPHIRVCDHTTDTLLATVSRLQRGGVDSVLLVSGDGAGQGTDCLQAIRAVSESYSLGVYAAFDPYRGNLSDETRYAEQKLAAGARGLFTQPFFDVGLAQSVMGLFSSVCLYVGVSPVLTPKSQAYWEKVNHVTFPSSFEATFDWNTRLAADLLWASEAMGQQVYMMPIRCEVTGYLKGVVEQLTPT